MTTHSSATLREETLHVNDALKRRAQSIINDKSIDAQTRAVIRYGLEINDPWLPELVRCINVLYNHSRIGQKDVIELNRKSQEA